ncbi:hypothetical protein [Streptomyces sp. NPDC088812]|uniref:hypothetical protein n=1 Tax=Streptomyces sp. NPDC088812 TaxID=3365905 RepID=UPI003818C97D
MSEITGQTGHLRAAAIPVVHESYSFACMRCGHAWEQSYEIEHHTDADGHEFVLYVADGRTVPSPLSRPACLNCDGHLVRIMRAGQVASVLSAARRPHRTPPAGPVEAPEPATGSGGRADGRAAGRSNGSEDGRVNGREDGRDDRYARRPRREHHWHLSDLLHPFQHRAG